MKDQQKWVEKSMHSLDGMRRAKAPDDLFLKIQNQISVNTAKVISLQQIRYACAAAAFLLLVNGVLCSMYLTDNNQQFSENVVDSTPSNSLISDYNIYK